MVRKDLFEEFCHEYTREMNRLEWPGDLAAHRARTEFAKADREIRKLGDADQRAASPPFDQDRTSRARDTADRAEAEAR